MDALLTLISDSETTHQQYYDAAIELVFSRLDAGDSQAKIQLLWRRLRDMGKAVQWKQPPQG
jgi:hypothetical protein